MLTWLTTYRFGAHPLDWLGLLVIAGGLLVLSAQDGWR